MVLPGYKEIPHDNPWETKYQRIGHFDVGRVCDKLVLHCRSLLRGGMLPKRWAYTTSNDFVGKFGDGVVWANTKSYHCCFVDGEYAFRIWTNAGVKYAWVDLPGYLNGRIPNAVPIPAGSLHKCRPMTCRFKASTVEDIDLLVEVVRDVYGLDS